MRLLNTHTLQLQEFFEPKIPSYAILSHRWEDGEILFADMLNGSYSAKKGLNKIRRACNVALRDELDYIWVDTCNIDKSSSAELSEAINSMYRWYQMAEVCYAYMSDVRAESGTFEEVKLFADSIWFKRGWTLQELIAPDKLEFYGADWSFLGTREQLKGLISDVTGVDIRLLEHGRRPSLNQFSIAQRMSWASCRETTRLEDRAYSLLGLFEVNIPLIYGEGERAFIRLQEEILKKGIDLSIFAWNFESYAQDFYTKRLFATSPDDFRYCGNVVLCRRMNEPSNPETTVTMTNVGLRIENPLIAYYITTFTRKIGLSLECRDDDVTSVLVLQLEPMYRLDGESSSLQESDGKLRTLCYPGWSDDLDEKVSGVQRVTRMDLDAPLISPEWPVVTIPRDIYSAHSMGILVPPRYTHLWVKLPEGERELGQWEFLKVYPQDLWREDNSTLDLQWENQPTGDEPVAPWFHISIVLSNSLRGQYTIFIAFSPLNVVRLKVLRYDPFAAFNRARVLGEKDEKKATSFHMPSGESLLASIRPIKRSGIFIAILDIEVRSSESDDSQK